MMLVMQDRTTRHVQRGGLASVVENELGETVVTAVTGESFVCISPSLPIVQAFLTGDPDRLDSDGTLIY